jgi:hypothetical protein
VLKKLVISIILFFPLAVGAQSASPSAKVFDLSGKVKSDFTFFDPNYSGGVEMALGDINGDGLEEIILCPGSDSKANVKSYSAYGVEKDQFQAFADNFSGGCYLSSADINGDSQDEVVVGAGYGGGPHVKVFEIGKELNGFFAFSKNSRQGVRVSVQDLGSDGKAEIIAYSNYNSPATYALFGNDGHKIAEYNLSKEFNSNGLSLAAGDYNGDGSKEFAIAGGYGNKAEIKIFDINNKLLKTIAYYKSDYTGGLNLAAGDINGDKKDEIIVAESFNGSGDVSAYNFNGDRVLFFSVFAEQYSAGLKVAVGDVNGDGQTEIVAVPERVGLDLEKADYKFISVDLSKQTLYRYQNGMMLDKFLISSGKANTPTPVGDYKIFKKRPLVRMSWYFGAGNPQNYDLPNVPWVASFNGPYTIHGTYWHRNFGHPMSHGCVNMYTPDAKTVYNWVDIGTPVAIN